MSDNRANIKINDKLHQCMKKIAEREGLNLKDSYEKAIEEYIQKKEEKELISNSELEKMLDERFEKVDKHLASMLGKNGLDTSMVLIGMAYFLEDYYEKDITKIFNTLRKDGVEYFTNKNDKFKRTDREPSKKIITDF
ncbi:MAG: hypothetical protein ACRC3Y_05100 [Romboutsia sp.]|uniref:hypothetical protein n=1 Tax=Romboutsia sp. TaxID=1965302 RepID=UPI003F3C63C7